MPLPTNPEMRWPPKHVDETNATYARWAAWYSGSPDKLATAYQGSMTTADDAKGHDEQNAGMFARSRERMFWGRTRSPGDNSLRNARLHVPLAADIASTSADLLFGELPTFYCADDAAVQAAEGGTAVRQAHKATQARLDKAVEEQGIQARLLEAAEIAAAYGGVYVRVGWDLDVAEMPFLDAITPDRAVPEWRSGRLAAVTFWRILPPLDDDKSEHVWRHLERHERVDGQGVILHGLYLGTADKIGTLQPLTRRDETAMWAAASEAGAIATGASRLAVEYIPNMLPNRSAPGSALGRSDYDGGVDGVLDSLDEAWTSWMRDVRLGKGRLIVPDEYTRSLGRGKGTLFDPEQEIFQTVSSMPANEGIDMELVQFAIRVIEHRETCAGLTAVACRGAGYSVQTFGEHGDQAATTATEVVARDGRSLKTRARKIGYVAPTLRRLLATFIEIDIAQFNPPGVQPIVPRVEFPDGVAKDAEQLARTVQLLFGAEAASLYTRIKMVNPDWDDQQIKEEVARIKQEAKEAMPELPPPGEATAGNGDGNTQTATGRPPT